MKTIKEQVKALWVNSFDDTKEFVDFFFENIYSNKNCVTIELDNQIVAALQIIPFEFKYFEKVVPVAYLYAICTDKKYRNMGFMRKLMDKTHKKLDKIGYFASILIPAENYLFDIYAKYGYKIAFYKSFIKYGNPENFTQNNDIQIFKITNQAAAYQFFRKKCAERAVTVLPTEKYFVHLCQSFEVDKKHIFIAKNAENQITGIAFVSEKGVVMELLAKNREIELAILNYILQLFDTEKIKIKLTEKPIPYGMIKILNEEIDFERLNTPYMNLMLDD
jgi:predicted acetyltransferase